jgi:hypothetical protein
MNPRPLLIGSGIIEERSKPCINIIPKHGNGPAGKKSGVVKRNGWIVDNLPLPVIKNGQAKVQDGNVRKVLQKGLP